MVKLPYGISNFETLVTDGYVYIDRTAYLEQLERMSQRYLFFLRPRRFGKSLFLSVLQYYYDIRHQNKFNRLFGAYYIGQHPTPLANQFLILKFDFSQIETHSFERTYQGFLNNVKESVLTFTGFYPNFFTPDTIETIKNSSSPAAILQSLLRSVETDAERHKIYLLIDEYDHFANEILSFRFEEFTKMVGSNGFVRKFYEAIKVGTQSGVIDRIFVSGVSPITLDSLTSGFNISTNISLKKGFNSMVGFKEKEVEFILQKVGVEDAKMGQTLALMRSWYNGYTFSEDAEEKLYNSDMVLYFALEYSENGKIPAQLLDVNIASDYKKIRRIFQIKNQEKIHLQYLNELLETGALRSDLVRLFEIEHRFNRSDFISLLYYQGIITIAERDMLTVKFKMPNYVIKELYYQYFHQIIAEQSQTTTHQIDLSDKVKALALHNDLKPVIDYTQSILTQLSNRDKRNFGEKYIKIILTSIFFTAGIYHIKHEFEVQKSSTERGYVDVLLLARPPFQVKRQVILEVKYLKRENAHQTEKIKEEATKQLKSYLKSDNYLQQLENLSAYVVLFVGNEGIFEQINLTEK
ncbi:MAG: AAA family ATPase [Bacteroidota bacterium]